MIVAYTGTHTSRSIMLFLRVIDRPCVTIVADRMTLKIVFVWIQAIDEVEMLADCTSAFKSNIRFAVSAFATAF